MLEYACGNTSEIENAKKLLNYTWGRETLNYNLTDCSRLRADLNHGNLCKKVLCRLWILSQNESL